LDYSGIKNGADVNSGKAIENVGYSMLYIGMLFLFPFSGWCGASAKGMLVSSGIVSVVGVFLIILGNK